MRLCLPIRHLRRSRPTCQLRVVRHLRRNGYRCGRHAALLGDCTVPLSRIVRGLLHGLIFHRRRGHSGHCATGRKLLGRLRYDRRLAGQELSRQFANDHARSGFWLKSHHQTNLFLGSAHFVPRQATRCKSARPSTCCNAMATGRAGRHIFGRAGDCSASDRFRQRRR